MASLNSIITEQIAMYNNAVHVDNFLKNAKKFQLVEECSFTYLFGHPEYILKKEVLELMQTKVWNWRLCLWTSLIVLCRWGCDFRPAFENIRNIKANLPEAVMIALTPTATEKTQKAIKDKLGLKDNVFVVSLSPDRPNIKVSVKNRPPTTGGENSAEASYNSVLKGLMEELRADPDSFARTVVYMKLR